MFFEALVYHNINTQKMHVILILCKFAFSES